MFIYFIFYIIINHLYCNACFYKCDKKNLFFDIFSSFFMIYFYKYKKHITPNLKFIMNLKNSICLNNIDFTIYMNNIYDNNEFNLSEIYSEEVYKSNTIRIIHKTKNSKNKILCVFGVLESDIGLKIELEMLEWLTPNYDVYCVYQDYPGKYYEYPALKFAQWLVERKNNICLYIHTKGAFFNKKIQDYIKNCWKNEYSGLNKYKYINPIKNNITDITSITSSKERILWFNSFFINKKEFEIIDEIKLSNFRYDYERLFKKHKEIRTLGILGNNVDAKKATNIINKFKK